ncbi:hypothetical protein KQI42_19995 [Tissierella sp. MSJ-40]|uniref:DnaD domain protein n=1 Tax=Tissierella simiarum TaxID=2841534 RepID=A0ABS6EBH2_9FIRM|nr:hypothetical protein [Tissierella simiarum]MBU5440280.1 hypothetical protein [Tissierella simiarum]
MKGWVRLHRQIVDSDIYQMPPLYLRTFERLLMEANHQDNEIPYKEKGSKITGKKLIRRGERLTSVRDICRWVAWYERGKLKVPNAKTIQDILDWLEENDMITIYGDKGNRTETHYTIVNYNAYQGEEDEEVTEKKQFGNSLETENKQSLETNKNVNNVKNDKNVKEDIYILSDDEKQFLDILNQIENYPLDREKDLEMYKTLGERYPALNLLEAIEQWKMYKLDQPLKAKSNPRSQINTSFKKYVEWGKCLKNNKTASKSTQSNFKRTRFHTEKNRTDNYTNDELEDIFQRKRREAKERQERGG